MTTTSANNSLRPLFHPYELAFCGYSGSGKTTLISRLIKALTPEFDIGYVKHDVHQFQMDKEGKDTFKAWHSGASQVLISDPRHTATIYQDPPDLVETQFSLLKKDIVFLEGYKNTAAPKIVVIDDKEKILDLVRQQEVNNILAFVGENNEPPQDLGGLPYFQRDDIAGLKVVVREVLQARAQQVPLFGLVLTGGYSTRMKTDKALLKYREHTQAEIGHELLSAHCEQTFLSCRKDQWTEASLKALPHIHDTFCDLGPLGGILSAMKTHPEAAWLVIACDLPFLEPQTLHHLVKKRNPFRFATCFQSETCELPEPLCTIYEPKSYRRLLQFVGMGYRCPRKALIHSPVQVLQPVQPGALDNVNTQSEFKDAQNKIATEAII